MAKEDQILWLIVLGLLWLFLLQRQISDLRNMVLKLFRTLDSQLGDVPSEFAELKSQFNQLEDSLADIQESVNEASMTPLQREAHRESKTFERKLPLRPEPFLKMAPGDRTLLWMKVIVGPTARLIYSLEYRHREIEQIPSDPKYPIAKGEARVEGVDKDWQPVRILFSPRGAMCRGLALEGDVKDWEPRIRDLMPDSLGIKGELPT